MLLVKSEKAKQELASKQRSISVRARSALFLADGTRTLDQLVWLLQGDQAMLQMLMMEGYLLTTEQSKAAARDQLQICQFGVDPDANGRFAPFSPAGSYQFSSQTLSQTSSQTSSKPSPFANSGFALSAGAPLTQPEAVRFETAPALIGAAPTSSSDTFEGKRSLATTRMFLFDICERMFVRKNPELANQFRDQLRYARDRNSMLTTAREIIFSVEEIAGPERADGLSERLAMMLPPED